MDHRPFRALFVVVVTLAVAAIAALPAQAQDGSAPDPPSGLSTVVSHDLVTVTWDDPGDGTVVGYVVLRRDKDIHPQGTFVTLAPDTGSAATVYVDAGVEPDRRYVYRIKAISAAGTSDRSGWVRAYTPRAPEPAPGLPASPTGLSTEVSHDSVTLSWDDPGDGTVTGYVILRRDKDVHPQGTFQTITADTGSAATAYTDDTAQPERRYVYRIKAINAHGRSDISSFVRAHTPAAGDAATEPSPASGVGAKEPSDGASDAPGAGPVWSAALTVEEGAVPIGESSVPVSYEAEDSSNTFAGNAVASSRRCGECSGGQAVRVIGDGNANYLVFNGVNANTAGEHTITIYYKSGQDRSLSVSANNGPAQTLSGLDSGSWSTVASVEVSLTLDAGANTIKVFNDSSWAPDIDRITVAPIGEYGDGPPGAPLDPWAEPADASLVLRWAAPAEDNGLPVTGYSVQYRREDAAWTAWPHSGTATEATITDLDNATAYEARVAAVSDAGTGEYAPITTAVAPVAQYGTWRAAQFGATASPPMGWASWNAFYARISEDIIKGIADAMVSKGFRDVGYEYVNIDDGWFEKRRKPDNVLQIKTNKFPGAACTDDVGSCRAGNTSFRPLVDYIHNKGLKAGIYSDRGFNTCIQSGGSTAEHAPTGTQLEREVGLWGHLQQDTELFFVTWDFDFIKLDSCGIAWFYNTSEANIQQRDNSYFQHRPLAPPGGGRYLKISSYAVPNRADMTPLEIARLSALFADVREALIDHNPDGDFVYSVATWGHGDVQHWGAESTNMWRNTYDIRTNWAGNRRSFLGIVDIHADLALYSGPYRWADPDMLFINQGAFDGSTPLKLAQARSHFGLWAVMNAPLLMGFDIRQDIRPGIQSILTNTEVIALNQDPGVHQAIRANTDSNHQVFVKTLDEGPGVKAVALFNRSGTAANITVTRDHLKFQSGTTATVRDLWAKADLAEMAGADSGYTVNVAAHDTKLLLFRGTHALTDARYLSELPGIVHVVSNGDTKHARPDKSINGNALRLAGTRYEYGIGVHADSHIQVKLDGRYQRFTATVGIDDEVRSGTGAVTFSVYGDGTLMHKSVPLSRGDTPKNIDVDISGVDILDLVVDGGTSTNGDHADWADAKLHGTSTPAVTAGCTIMGTDASETLRGTDGDDVICASDASDAATEPSDAAGAGPVWSAALTVGEDASYVPTASGYSVWGLGGTLTEDTFTVGTTAYRVLVLARQSGGLVLGLDEELEADFTLTVGGVSYAAQDGSRPEAMYADAYWWDAHQHADWSAGDTLEVSLTVASGPRPQLPLAPPTAYFRQVPDSHNGVDAFSVRLHFSQDVATDAENLRDHALSVTGASIVAVERVNGSNRIWDITVAPGSGDVTVAVPEGTVDHEGVILSSVACDAAGAICTSDGRKLYNRPEFTVAGPDPGSDSSSEQAPAAEDTPAWSATMTVKWVHWGWGYYSTSAKQAGSLSVASFEVDGTTYTVNMVETSGWMYIGFDRQLPFGFVLELDGARFASTDASFQSYSYSNLYQWRGANLGWRDGDTVEIRLLRTAEEIRINAPATGVPTISGTVQVGETLTVATSGIADPDGMAGAQFAYRWTAAGSDIDGATGSSLTLTPDERGQTIRVRVSFIDDAGFSESLTSLSTPRVVAVPNNAATGAPTISGMARVNRVLRVDTSGIADPDGMAGAGFAHQWTAGGSDIDGAVGAGLTLTPDMAGQAVGVRVSFTDDAGFSESLTSLSTMPVQPASECPGAGSGPAPRSLAVASVPVVVDSTVEKYYVLYVLHQLNDDTAVEIPVSVTLGQAGTTTLSEQLSPLPAERYRVDEFLVAEPGDLDGDCIDDVAELGDLGAMNPLNRAPAVDPAHGVVAIPDRETFEAMSYQGERVLVDTHLRDLEFVKFYLFDMDTDRPVVYFMNTQTHRTHRSFAYVIGLSRKPHWQQGAMKGEIVYHPNVVAPDGSLGVYRFEFEPQDAYSFEAVAYAYEVLAASMPLLEGNFAYYPMPARALPLYHRERELYDASRVDVLLEEDVFPDVDFIALNEAEGYGFLRVMSLEERPDPRDVVIYETLPNELSRVAGIITTVPQTPLSHVNLRAVQDGVPNAFIRGALDNDDVDDLIDSFVHYSVSADGWTLRAATPAEVDAHYAASRPSQPQTPQRDLAVTQIAALGGVGFGDWTAFGVKAANVAVLGTLGFAAGTVPEGFAVPFYFYDEFMKHNGFYDDVEEMLADADFQSDFDTQAGDLKKLRKKIKKGETPEWIIEALEAMHATYPEGQSLRYRSSTNNEDLPGFSGAGLYDSKTQDPDETAEDGIDKSIKGVWASLWNFRAFTEREFHRIDHLAAAMGVLVHPNFSDELANGVAVSFDPYGRSDGSYYVNTQLGEDLVTNPEAHSVPEELLLHPDGTYTVTAHSNQIPAGQLLMSDAQIEQLRLALGTIHDRFEELYGIGPGEQFAIEIEYKITSDNILSIKQARPWVFGAS